MRASNAIQLKGKVRRLSVRKAAKVEKKKAKVIVLPLERLRRRPKALTQRDRDDLVLSHRDQANKMARSILRKWHARLDLEEVGSVVDLSLCEAAKNFNPRKGAGFLTFLFYHLRGNLIRSITEAAASNGIPFSALSKEHDSRAEQEPSGSFSSADITESLCDQAAALPDEVAYQHEVMNFSLQVCSKLDRLEQEILRRVFMGDEQLLNIADSLGYSRCHISRVKKRALTALCAELKSVRGDDREMSDIMQALDAAPRRKRISARRKVNFRPRANVQEVELEAAQFQMAM